MSILSPTAPSELRALLVLGRVSNLPTVWSNCLAAWWLGGGGAVWRVGLICLGATCLYIGGMFLNDAFDVGFDRAHRRERPIPSGAVSLRTVWTLGLVWMILGLGTLMFLGKTVAVLAILLAASILIYDAVHKLITFSPVLMASCRFLLFLVAAAAGTDGINGLALWSAFALAGYIVGLSYVARHESLPGALRFWPVLCVALPLGLAFFANGTGYRLAGALFSGGVAAWLVWCLGFTFWNPQRNVGRTVSGLLAGIVLVDWLAVCGGSGALLAIFPLLFASALCFQRFVPAT